MKVFLSYKRTDLAAARDLQAKLLIQRPEWEIYFDLDQLRAGAFWTEALDKALQEASAFIFLIGEQIGDWQRMEYAMAIQRKVKAPSLPLLPLVLPDGRRDRLAFMEAIQQIDWGMTNAAAALGDVIRGIEQGPQQALALWSLISPYRGLTALGVEDAGFLYGRDGDLDRILEHLAQEREPKILTILGASGVGKSSFVKAGLFAALLRESRRPGEEKPDWPEALKGSRRWLMASLRPGVSPVYELAKLIVGWTREDPEKPAFQTEVAEWRTYLMKPGFDLQGPLDAAKEGCKKLKGIWPERILLHVDQAEELYAQASPEEARRFSEILAASRRIPGLQIILTMRSDYYPELQRDNPLWEAGERIDLRPLDAAGLGAMIRQPAESLGAIWEEPKLPERLQEMAAEDPENGAPLLSHALSRLWSEMQARRDGKLRGDPASDLSDFLLSGLKKQDTALLRRLFALRLTRAEKANGQKGDRREGDPDRIRFTRRRAWREELTAEEWALAQKLAGPKHRLLRLGWEERAGRDQGFAEVAHESLLRSSRFGEWVKADEAFVLWLARLDRAAEDWRTGGRDPGALLMGRVLIEAEKWTPSREADLTPAHREFLQASLAERAALEAEREERRLAHEAEKEKRLQVERRMSRRTLAAACGLAVLSAGLAVAWMIATGHLREARTMQSRYLADQAMRQMEEGDYGTAASLALEAADKAATQEAIDALYLSGEVLREIAAFPLQIDSTTDAASMRLLTASLSHMGGSLVWDISTPRIRILWAMPEEAGAPLHMSADGSRVATLSPDGGVGLHDVGRRTQIWKTPGDDRAISAFLNADGGRLVILSQNDLRIWDVARERLVGLENYTSTERGAGAHFPIPLVSLSADGRKLAISSANGLKAHVWDLASGALQSLTLADPEARSWTANMFALSPDGSHLAIEYAQDEENRIALWRVESDAKLWDEAFSTPIPPFSMPGSMPRRSRALWSPNGRSFAPSAPYMRVRSDASDVDAPSSAKQRKWLLLDAWSGSVIAETPDGPPLAWNPDGQRLLWGMAHNGVRILNLEDKEFSDVFGRKCASGPAFWTGDGRGAIMSCSVERRYLEPEDMTQVWDVALDAPSLLPLGSYGALRRLDGESEYVVLMSPAGVTAFRNFSDEPIRRITQVEGESALLEPSDILTISDDGSRFVTRAMLEHEVRIRLMETGEVEATLSFKEEGGSGAIDAASLNAGGSRVAVLWRRITVENSAGEDRVNVRDAGGDGNDLGLEASDVQNVALSPDGRLLAMSTYGGEIQLLDAASGKKLKAWQSGWEPLNDESAGESGLFWDQGSSRIAGRDAVNGSVTIWDADTGEALGRIPRLQAWTVLRFEGEDLLFWKSERNSKEMILSVRRLPIDWRRQAADLRARLPRHLICEQRRDFFLDDPQAKDKAACARWWEVPR